MGRPLNPSEIELILTTSKQCNNSAKAAERVLSQEPYFSRDQNFSDSTILRYARAAGLLTQGRGGANNTGKRGKYKVH